MTIDMLIEIYDRIPSELQTIFLVVVLFFGYKGSLKLPFIKSKKTHEGCSLYPSMIRNAENQARIIRIKQIDTIYDQMSIVEVAHTNILLKMMDLFRTTKPSTLNVGRYDNLIKVMEHELKNIIRKWVKENHFTSRTELEFNQYIKEKIDFIVRLIGNRLDFDFNGYEISREELKKIHYTEFINYVSEQYTKVFFEIREVSREKEILVKQIEEGKE